MFRDYEENQPQGEEYEKQFSAESKLLLLRMAENRVRAEIEVENLTEVVKERDLTI